MLKPTIAAFFALLGLILFSPMTMAGNSTEGVILHSPIDGVTVVTVSSDVREDLGPGTVPAVNVSNRNVVVIINSGRRLGRLRCGIGVPYPWLRKTCLDPLYPF